MGKLSVPIGLTERSDRTKFLGEIVRLRELGEFRLEHDGLDLTPRQDKLRSTLALLSIKRGSTVSHEMIIDELWGASPPDRARGTVHTYIYDLRRGLSAQSDLPATAVLSTQSRGYVLQESYVESDLDDFERLCDDAYRALSAGGRVPERKKMETASTLLTEALAMWTGDPFANVSCGDRLESHALWLRERKAEVLRTRLWTDLELGRSGSLIAELKILAKHNPFQEDLSELLMLALARSGRRFDALREFDILRDRLVDELGLEPTPLLQELQQTLLSGSVDACDSPWITVPAPRSATVPSMKQVWHPPRPPLRTRPNRDDAQSGWQINHLRFD